MNWHLQDAKDNFSKVVHKACTEGPQTVTMRGKPAVVVLSAEDCERLAANRPSPERFLPADVPIWDDEFVEDVNRRNKSPGRDLDL